MRMLLSLLLVVLTITPAWADGYTYSPEGCEFAIDFPEESHVTRRCHDKLPDKCDLMNSYTKVFDLDATVNFYVSCKPSSPDARQAFTPDVMRTSLLARPKVGNLEVYDISYADSENATMAALLGAGPSDSGNDVMVYTTQIWIGDKSTLTMEAELIGEGIAEADDLFSTILQSMRHKEDKVSPPETEADSEGDAADAKETTETAPEPEKTETAPQ